MRGNYLQISGEILFWFTLLRPLSRDSKFLSSLEIGGSFLRLSTWIHTQLNLFVYQGIWIPRFQFGTVSNEALITAYGKSNRVVYHLTVYIQTKTMRLLKHSVLCIKVVKEFV